MDAAALLLGLAALMLITFLGLEAAALVRWRGAWRVAAAVPALALAGVVSRVALDVRRDPTSHNLWPLEIAVWLLGGLMMMASCLACEACRAPGAREGSTGQDQAIEGGAVRLP